MTKPERAAESREGAADERRARIITAAITEFAKRGYVAASTNAIAVDAGVAKGLLFHHFGSKEALYLAAFDQVVEQTTPLLFEGITELPHDLFERFLMLSMRKLQLFRDTPDAYHFITAGLAEAPTPVREAIMKKQAELTQRYWPRMMEGLESTRLRPGVTLNDAIELISLLMEGFERRTTPLLKTLPDRGTSLMPSLFAKAHRLLEHLRDGLYNPPVPPTPKH